MDTELTTLQRPARISTTFYRRRVHTGPIIEQVPLHYIDQDVEDYFVNTGVKLSAEEDPSGHYAFIYYADYGAVEEDGETPREFIYLVPIKRRASRRCGTS